MYQIEIDIVQVQVIERLLQGRLNILGVVLVIPQLGGDEEIFARDTALFDSRADGLFGAITVL